MRPAISSRWLGVGLALLLFSPAPGFGQIPDSLQLSPRSQATPDTLVAPESTGGPISPKGAFLRSALIPGWGHAEVGAYGRGAFYFALESGVAFMFLKSHSRLSLARDRLAMWESVITARLQAQGVEDLDALEEALASDERVADLRGLEVARSSQREDWMALGIFFLFLGGADAFVSAHLADFPPPVEINVDAAPTGRMEVSVSVPVSF